MVETRMNDLQEQFNNHFLISCCSSSSGSNTAVTKESSSQSVVKFPFYKNGLVLNQDWNWDVDVLKSTKAEIDVKCKIVYFFKNTHSDGTIGVRGSKGFKSGIHYFEVKLNKQLQGSSIMIGFGTKNTRLDYDNYEYINLIGNDNESWGLSHRGILVHNSIITNSSYCDKISEADTRLGVLLDLYSKTISFYKNGVNLGVAFKNINCTEALYPIISSTATEVEMELTKQYRIYLNLQEICYNKIIESLNRKNIDNLNIPKSMIFNLKRIA